MFTLNNDESVNMCQGDTGSVLYHLDNFTLEAEDKACFIVHNNGDVLFKKYLENLEHGIGYFIFDSEDTQNIDPGKYSYDILVNIIGNGTVTTHSNNDFIIDRSWSNEL